MSNYNSYESAEERIISYFVEFVNDINVDSEKDQYIKDTAPYIVKLLMPYALENNYWWEEKSIKMAYHQMRLSDYVVDYNDFLYYYEKLMGKKYNPLDFASEEEKKNMYKEADKKYAALTKKR